MDAELTLGFGVSYTAAKLRSLASIWMQNCHWALACQSPLPTSDPGTSEETITATGILCVLARPSIRIQSSDHCYQMTLISDDKWNCKKNLAYLGQQMDPQLPLGLGMWEIAVKIGSGA
ncbi:aphrodisin-like protein [Cricetulus griseus]|uniref:Aphrodisin-like protein n=1 Tax=Cricetulus griseus TaxID=10029 RepID=A0A061I610_CRIGR|nr:aphrodisin-like protein [Cricetulus griseus]